MDLRVDGCILWNGCESLLNDSILEENREAVTTLPR